MADYRLLHGDCLEVLPTLPAGSVHCCISSPPYFGLRAYLKADDPARAAELGAERTPGEYVARLVRVFAEVRRVLHTTGLVWLNLGDSYAANGPGGDRVKGLREAAYGKGNAYGKQVEAERGKRSAHAGRRPPAGLPSKNLLGMPWRVAFALQEDGWVLRAGCPWVKINAMPESVKDRPASAVEYVFLFAKGPAYFYDQEVVRKPYSAATAWKGQGEYDARTKAARDGQQPGQHRNGIDSGSLRVKTGSGRSRRNSDWWFESAGLVTDDDGEPLGFDVPTRGDSVAHFAVMPAALVLPCVLAGTSAKGACPACGAPWVRVTEKASSQGQKNWSGAGRANGCPVGGGHFGRTGQWSVAVETTGWQPSCACPAAASPVPCTILDPFAGVSTVGVVALKHGRRFVGVELNRDYLEMGRKRLDAVDGPLFAAGGAG